MLHDHEKQHIDVWCSKFPAGKQRSAVIMALRIVQDSRGHLTDDLMKGVADYLSMPLIEVAEVASFYSLYRFKPHGAHTIKVCDSLSCCMRGAEHVTEFLKNELGIDVGQTTADGQITLEHTECLAACTDAPCVIVNDKDYHRRVSKKSLRALIDDLRGDEKHED